MRIVGSNIRTGEYRVIPDEGVIELLDYNVETHQVDIKWRYHRSLDITSQVINGWAPANAIISSSRPFKAVEAARWRKGTYEL